MLALVSNTEVENNACSSDSNSICRVLREIDFDAFSSLLSELDANGRVSVIDLGAAIVYCGTHSEYGLLTVISEINGRFCISYAL